MTATEHARAVERERVRQAHSSMVMEARAAASALGMELDHMLDRATAADARVEQLQQVNALQHERMDALAAQLHERRSAFDRCHEFLHQTILELSEEGPDGEDYSCQICGQGIRDGEPCDDVTTVPPAEVPSG